MILVTGGNGYVGRLLVQDLEEMGERVRVLDTNWFTSNASGLESANVEQWHQDVSLGVSDGALEGVDTVIHLAGLSNDPTADFSSRMNNRFNVGATRMLATAVAERAKKDERPIRFIYASTCSVYYTPPLTNDNPNVSVMDENMPVAPTANYSKTKRMSEIYLLNLMSKDNPYFEPVIVRKGTLFGLSPRMRFDLAPNTMTAYAWLNDLITVNGPGEVWRPLLHVQDAVDAYIHLIHAPSAAVHGEIFNLVHKNYRVLELAHWISEVINGDFNRDIRVWRNRTADDGGRSYYVDGSKITRQLGFQPARGVREAVRDIWLALEDGLYGEVPTEDPIYHNIKHLKNTVWRTAA